MTPKEQLLHADLAWCNPDLSEVWVVQNFYNIAQSLSDYGFSLTNEQILELVKISAEIKIMQGRILVAQCNTFEIE